MLKLEVRAIMHGQDLILEVEDDIRTKRLIQGIKTLLGDEEEGMLISIDKEGVLPDNEKLTDLMIRSGEELLYVKGGSE